MAFPLYFLIIPYLIFLVIWVILSLIGYYHLLRFGGKKIGIMIWGLIYFIGCIVLVQLSYDYLMPIDWQLRVTVFETAAIRSSFEGPVF